jgi:hypothetical protein
MIVAHKVLEIGDRQRLLDALKMNGEGGCAIMMDKDTSFAGTAEEVPVENVVNAVRSVPCHY